MKTILYSLLIITASVWYGCQTGDPKSKLTATAFSDKLKQSPTATLIDVRTPEEFSQGHIQNAVNYDWNGNQFEQQVAPLDKSKPLYVYCLSGGRSSAAASKLRSDGFKEVYELEGGMMKWRSANLPESTDIANASAGMTMEQFTLLLNSEKSVLIDFYAEWCAPCKRMSPYIDGITKEMEDKVVVLRINADENKNLLKELKIDALPVLQLYKNKTMYWNHSGYIDKAGIVKEIK